MASFTTRVELHDATWQNYNTLHQEMEREGFARTISSDDGTVYELPTAEYNFSGQFTRSQVLEKAKRAAAKTGKSSGILVTESAGRTWSGLVQIKSSQRA